MSKFQVRNFKDPTLRAGAQTANNEHGLGEDIECGICLMSKNYEL